MRWTRGEIYWSPTGNPRRKVYLDQSAGVPVQDIWMDFRDAHNQNICVTGYPTEKNPSLLRRLILASSNPGDLVLDCFSGSGTTLEVAERAGRQWIGIDNSIEAVTTTLGRFAHGTERMGDFVQACQAEQESHGSIRPSLFDGLPTDTVTMKTTSPLISDFDLFTTADGAQRATTELADWLGPNSPFGTSVPSTTL